MPCACASRIAPRRSCRRGTRILADDGISIVAMIQREPGEGEEQTDIIMLTHKTRERNVDTAIAGIAALSAVKGPIIRLRLEDLQ